jgi:hypothetical protein
MFFIFGTQIVRRDVKDSLPQRAHCARCGFISDLRQQREQRYLSLFFLPVVPISKADSILTCNRCGAGYYANHPDVHSVRGTDAGNEKAVLVCPNCTGKMRVPSSFQKAIRVTCPHCRDQFTVTVSKA